MKKTILSSTLVQVFVLVLFAIGTLVVCALNITGPTTIGTVQTNSAGKIIGLTLEDFQKKNTVQAEIPMMVLNYRDTTNAVWGYVLLTSTNDIRFITNHFKLTSVVSGNFLDSSYAPGALPMWSPEGFYDVTAHDYLTNTPSQFLAIFWLDGR